MQSQPDGLAQPKRLRVGIIVCAAAVGAALGGAAIAGAATSGTSGASPATSATSGGIATAPTNAPDPAQMSHGPDETLLTGTTADKVKAAALAAMPAATVIRVETDSAGSPYEAHLTKADGTDVTVKVDANFAVTATEQGFGGGGPHGGPGGPGGAPSTSAAA